LYGLAATADTLRALAVLDAGIARVTVDSVDLVRVDAALEVAIACVHGARVIIIAGEREGLAYALLAHAFFLAEIARRAGHIVLHVLLRAPLSGETDRLHTWPFSVTHHGELVSTLTGAARAALQARIA
jgi:hypothetical protein